MDECMPDNGPDTTPRYTVASKATVRQHTCLHIEANWAGMGREKIRWL